MPGLCSAGDRTQSLVHAGQTLLTKPTPQSLSATTWRVSHVPNRILPEQVAFGILSSDDRDSQFPCCHVTVNSADLYSVHSLIYRTSLPSHPTPSSPPLSLLHHCHRDPKPLTKGSCHPQCHGEGNICALSVVLELTVMALPGS